MRYEEYGPSEPPSKLFNFYQRGYTARMIESCVPLTRMTMSMFSELSIGCWGVSALYLYES